jgi:hypothetical protein
MGSMRRGCSKDRSMARASRPIREGLAPDPAARRHRHYGQSRQPQEQDRPPTDPISRRQTAVPAEVLPKSKPRSSRSFAKLKHLLRKAAARTLETVCTAIAELLGVLADAINLGLIATDSRPGGNVTGVSFRTEGLTSKQVELVPRIVRRRAATDHQ